MELKIQLSDELYQRLVSTGSRVQGTIGLVNPKEGNFNEHNKSRPAPGTRYIRLRHGKVSVSDEYVRLTLRVGLGETGIVPSEAITDESRQASDFVDEVFDRFNTSYGY